MTDTIKVNIKGYMYPLTLEKSNGRIFLQFNYNKGLIEEVKAMQGARWHGKDAENPRKVWSITDSPRNHFQLRFLSGVGDPYALYDAPLLPYTAIPRFNAEKQIEILPRECQQIQVQHIITRRQCIVAAEMGLGKSLGAILAMEYALEHFGIHDWWIVSNRAGVRAINRELQIWNSKVKPRMIETYDGTVRTVAEWRNGDKSPRGIIFDESQKVKNPATKRSQGSAHLSDQMRQDHNNDVFVVLMSGSPAPKSPVDWWHQCEVACPGFLREGNIDKLKKRLAVVLNKNNIVTGGVYPHLVCWLNDPKRCSVCGEFAVHPNHDPMKALLSTDDVPGHTWKESKNEVLHLYERMKGLVLVQFKKDWLKDLPEKQYRLINLQPSPQVLRTAQAIVSTAPSAIQALTLLRELSDGFQYKDVQQGEKTCDLCDGVGERKQQVEVPDSCPNCYGMEGDGDGSATCFNHDPKYEEANGPCEQCKGKKTVPNIVRITVEVDCPKEDLLKELLEEHEEIGRFATFAGFTGSIDRCVRIGMENGWHVARVDSRGWVFFNPKGEIIPKVDILDIFQSKAMREKYDKVLWVAHPESGGTSVTLTESPSEFYYSNSFKGEDRIQSEDRIHRLGMDVNRGATIIDCVHLPSDLKVLNNVKAKRDLQNMSMGELKETMLHLVSRDPI